MRNAPSNTDDVIDSRDVIARIAELEEEREAFDPETEAEAYAEWESENRAELEALRALENEAEGYASDWKYGETLIRDSYFERYAEELAEEVGAIDATAKWPYTCIDWERAARELQMDYATVDFAGVTYWIR